MLIEQFMNVIHVLKEIEIEENIDYEELMLTKIDASDLQLYLSVLETNLNGITLYHPD